MSAEAKVDDDEFSPEQQKYLIDRVRQIEASHASASPTTANPAWMNTHHDLGIVLRYVHFLERHSPATPSPTGE